MGCIGAPRTYTGGTDATILTCLKAYPGQWEEGSCKIYPVFPALFSKLELQTKSYKVRAICVLSRFDLKVLEMYPKFDILGCKGMTKTFHFIGEQTNIVHTLGTLCCYFEG